MMKQSKEFNGDLKQKQENYKHDHDRPDYRRWKPGEWQQQMEDGGF